MKSKIRPRIASSTWAELERIGHEVGIGDPREVIGYLARNYNKETPAEHSFRFGDNQVFSAIVDNDAPIMIRGKARVGKTRTAKALIKKLKSKHPILVMDPSTSTRANSLNSRSFSRSSRTPRTASMCLG